MRHLTPALCFALALSAPTLAQDEVPYVDNRSTPEAVVESYYSALSRGEFARAYSYFGADEAPADYEAWTAEYPGSRNVAVSFGQVAMEGAAGSIYYALPVTVTNWQPGDPDAALAGCFYLRLAQPAIQEPPFQPLHIERIELHPKQRAAFAPARCDGD